MDSATLEACHSFGEMCAKWLEKKKKKKAFNVAHLFNTCFWLWSFVTLSALKSIHNCFNTERAESEKLPKVQPNICCF